MTKTFELTVNELRAALVIVGNCLDGMGGRRPMDLLADPFTWCEAGDLIDAGWTRHEAAGTFGSLLEKGVVRSEGKSRKEGKMVEEFTLTEAAFRWLDTKWDDRAAIMDDTAEMADLSEDLAMIEMDLDAIASDDAPEYEVKITFPSEAEGEAYFYHIEATSRKAAIDAARKRAKEAGLIGRKTGRGRAHYTAAKI